MDFQARYNDRPFEQTSAHTDAMTLSKPSVIISIFKRIVS